MAGPRDSFCPSSISGHEERCHPPVLPRAKPWLAAEGHLQCRLSGRQLENDPRRDTAGDNVCPPPLHSPIAAARGDSECRASRYTGLCRKYSVHQEHTASTVSRTRCQEPPACQNKSETGAIPIYKLYFNLDLLKDPHIKKRKATSVHGILCYGVRKYNILSTGSLNSMCAHEGMWQKVTQHDETQHQAFKRNSSASEKCR